MLELRPTGENCSTKLPTDSTQAMIFIYECTFCRSCAEDVLGNVCPNCGGGFCPGPIRPKNQWRGELSTTHQPAGTRIVSRLVDASSHEIFAAAIKIISPENR